MITAEAFARCADANDLRLVVTSEDVLPATRTLLTLGARLGIPSLQVCHGVPSGTTTTHPGHTSTYLAAFSDYVKSLYRILAIPEDRIFVTGNPAWDRLAGPPRPGFRTEACAKLGLDPQQPVVVYALTHRDAWSTSTAGHTRLHLDHAEAVIKAFADLAKRHADWQFVLRPRPGSDSEAFVGTVVAEMARTGLARFAVDTLRPYASVVMADVFLTTESNMGIEALLQGKPVVNVNLRELWGDALAMGFGPVFADSKAVIHVDKAEDIAPAVESALLDDSTKTALQKARRAERERFNACNDGRAAQRVADLIVRLLHNNASRPWTASPGRYAAERSQRREQAQTLNRRGEQCFAHGDLDSALQHFSEALSTWREDAVIFNNMGTVLYALKDPVSAWRSFVQALHRDPNLQSARDNLRRVADDLKQEDEADRLLDTFGTDQQPSDE